MEHRHCVGDIIKVNRHGPPKYYIIEKITQNQFLVRKMPVHLVDYHKTQNGDLNCKFWVDWDGSCGAPPSSSVWVSGPNRKYVHKMNYPLYDWGTFTMIRKAPIWS